VTFFSTKPAKTGTKVDRGTRTEGSALLGSAAISRQAPRETSDTRRGAIFPRAGMDETLLISPSSRRRQAFVTARPRPRLLFLLTVLVPGLGGLGACGGQAGGSAHWIGKTYLLDIPPTHWSEPKGIGGDVSDFVPQFLIGVAGGAGQELAITLATAHAGVQDPCNPTTKTTSSGAGYPSAAIGAAAFPMHIVNVDHGIVVNTTAHDLAITNVLPGDAPAADGTLSATMDIAEAYPLFVLIPNATKDSVCMQLSSFGAPCEICAFNGQPYCLTLKAVELGATQASVVINPLTAADIPASCALP
jgi:hypothetical protein